jgi:very-short-patch-repair endonuclease
MTRNATGISRARALRHEATPPERRLWGFLRTLRHEGWHFRRQAPFRGYVLDFVCYGKRFVIEVDGAVHGDAARQARDATRDAVLAREGFRTLRFVAADVLRNLEGVSIEIRNQLAAAAPHPRPLPTRGRGAFLPPPSCGEGRGGGETPHQPTDQ